MSVLASLKSPITWAIAAILATGSILIVIYERGETAGAADVTAAVEHTTNLKVENARKDKDAADEKVRTISPDAVIDSTR
jgi:hypothetical protein